MNPEMLVAELRSAKEFFDRSTRCLTEEDSSFAPAAGTWTVAQQVAHAAQTVDWFLEGAFRPEGFDTNWDEHQKQVARVQSLGEARAWLEAAFARAIEVLGARTPEELAQPLPADGIMGGAPRFAIVSAISDHTAHHRGALTVYSRLLGRVPAMPYMDAPAEVTA
ncbi:MAG TPA: DinB family protein [Thermoanaerobaculia bacterium]|nr:DinB family protein [Thermoanaerobaculia bacterium]